MVNDYFHAQVNYDMVYTMLTRASKGTLAIINSGTYVGLSESE